MKQKCHPLLSLALLTLLTSCSETEQNTSVPLPNSTLTTNYTLPESSIGNTVAKEAGEVDIDLAKLSVTVAFGEMYQMMFYPNEYIGKTIHIAGEFFVYTHPDTGVNYYTVVIVDALTCCALGLEFLPPEGATFPEPYSFIQVVGEFETYEEYGYTNFRLKNVEII